MNINFGSYIKNQKTENNMVEHSNNGTSYLFISKNCNFQGKIKQLTCTKTDKKISTHVRYIKVSRITDLIKLKFKKKSKNCEQY